ncbi:MAG: substrate-binding domain-containing protein [Actinobacteria bacterium]|nr:substrate-binding domain-containing protein [Actinomycetota bacterium]
MSGKLQRIRAEGGRGIALPVGFDDIPAAAGADPPLTTVHQDHAEKGLLAGRMLVSQLRKEDDPSTGPLATSLVVRGSTSPLRKR